MPSVSRSPSTTVYRQSSCIGVLTSTSQSTFLLTVPILRVMVGASPAPLIVMSLSKVNVTWMTSPIS